MESFRCRSWFNAKLYTLIRNKNLAHTFFKLSNIANYCVIDNLRAQFKRKTKACYIHNLDLIQIYLKVNRYAIFGNVLKAQK